jgi:hypothetical protein
MERIAHLVVVMIAAAMHLAAPVIAYAATVTPAMPGDFCSASRSAPRTPARSPSPLPASHQHHCAHAPCCAGGAADAAAPPVAPLAPLQFAVAGVAVSTAAAISAPVAPITAAQPRGPPAQA